DGRWRRVKVKLNPPNGCTRLHAYSRVGYYAPAQEIQYGGGRVRRLRLQKGYCMRSKNGRISEGPPTAEHHSSRRVPGGYYKPPAEGTNFILLDPDVAEVFRDPESVNQVLRSLIKINRPVEAICL